MSDQCISFVADDNYLDHARAFLVNAKRQGQWTGDFCMISPENCNNGGFDQRGIYVLRVPANEWNFLVKFYTFTPYFRRWKHVLCSDLDVLVQDKLQRVFDELSPKLPRIYCGIEDGNTLSGLKQWDKIAGDGPDAHPEVYEAIERRFPHVKERMFNASFIFYTPESIPLETKDKLYAVHEEFKAANPSNADQMIINLHLYSQLRQASKNCTCFFGSDYPQNRVVSEFRGWDGTEVPVILHYTRWSAPWIEKFILEGGVEMGAYRNHRLGRVCHELYAENLAAFETEFPLE